jgi:GTPase SAR1 family protein
MVFIVGNKCDLDLMREVQLESVLEFKEMNNILYAQETSAKSGKNVEQVFTDCAKFLFTKYKDRMDQVGNDGDLSSDNDSLQNSVERSGSFKESGGHRVTRLNGKR